MLALVLIGNVCTVLYVKFVKASMLFYLGDRIKIFVRALFFPSKLGGNEINMSASNHAHPNWYSLTVCTGILYNMVKETKLNCNASCASQNAHSSSSQNSFMISLGKIAATLVQYKQPEMDPNKRACRCCAGVILNRNKWQFVWNIFFIVSF